MTDDETQMVSYRIKIDKFVASTQSTMEAFNTSRSGGYLNFKYNSEQKNSITKSHAFQNYDFLMSQLLVTVTNIYLVCTITPHPYTINGENNQFGNKTFPEVNSANEKTTCFCAINIMSSSLIA